jgi:Tol biopolymer transport system component
MEGSREVKVVKRRWALLVALALGLGTLMITSSARAVVPGPNGRIAFCQFIPEIDSCDLYTANPDGTDEQLLLAGPAEAPHWSPDGSRLAVATFAGDLVVTGIINPDGSGLVQFNTDLTFNTPALAWSPDGLRLAAEVWSDVDPGFAPGVFTMRSSDGGDLTRLTTNPYGGHDIPADYSPDGSSLLFLRENPQLNHHASSFALFTMNTDGTGLTQVTPWGLAAGGGRWSPDGTKIVFAGASNRPKGPLWMIHPDGTGLHKIFQDVRGGAAFQPTWSPEGDKIMFALLRFPAQGGQQDLYSVNADGTGLTAVTTTPDFEESPDWGSNVG